MSEQPSLAVEDFDQLDGTPENTRKVQKKVKSITDSLKDLLEEHPGFSEYVWPGVGRKNSSPYTSRPNKQSGEYWQAVWLGVAHRKYRQTVERPQDGVQLQFSIESQSNEPNPPAEIKLHLDQNAPSTVRTEVRQNLENNQELFTKKLRELDGYHLRLGEEIWTIERVSSEWDLFLEELSEHLTVFLPLTKEEVDELDGEIVRTIVDGFEDLLPLYSLIAGVSEPLISQNPTVWVEKTQIDQRGYKQSGELALGNAIFSPQRSESGQKIYESLPEADVGDIVLHLLQDRRQLVGASIVESELITDFDGPPQDAGGDHWTDQQRKQGGYLRRLGNYTEFETPIRIYDDFLNEEENQEQLEHSRESNTGLFYDRNHHLVQGAYLTRCPNPLVELFAEISPDLTSFLQEFGWQDETSTDTEDEFPPATSYNRVIEAMEDIQQRRSNSLDYSSNWLSARLTDSVIENWTQALSSVEPNAVLSSTAEDRCLQLLEFYSDQEEKFVDEAGQLGIGALGNLTPGETLFVALFRELQEQAGLRPNLNQVKIDILNEGAYTVQAESQQPPASESDSLSSESPPDVFQVPLSTNEDDPIRRNYRTTVLDDVSAEDIEPILDTTLDREQIRVWGNRGSVKESVGDRLLFGDRQTDEYLTVGTIEQSFKLTSDKAKRFAETVGWEGDGQQYTHIMVLSAVHEAELNAEQFWDQLGYSGFPYDTFSRIDFDRANASFADQYTSVSEFVATIQGRRLHPYSPSHPILTHYQTSDPAPDVWNFTSGPSDWLTIFRRQAIQVTDSKRQTWENVEEGDVILFHLQSKDQKLSTSRKTIRASAHGVLGGGIVSGHAQKTERWWWNELESLEYPYLLELDSIFVTSDLGAIDFSRATFELGLEGIQDEFGPLVENILEYTEAKDLIQRTTNKDFPAKGEFANLSQNRTGIEEFLRQLFDTFDPQPIDSPRPKAQTSDTERASGSLPSMLPRPSPPERSDELDPQLESTGQIVLYGPPGTGKTYIGKRFARWWITERHSRVPTDRLRTITFHPSFTYEDFMEGLSAEATEEGHVEYNIRDGIFKRACQEAQEAYRIARGNGTEPPRYVLLIDEINRGNLSKIFGETITQLEMDKRLDGDEETRIQWAHSGGEVAIPPNLYLVGTMNTADRSIALVDAALRRRFSFHSFPPDYSVFVDEYDQFDSKANIEAAATGDSPDPKHLLARSIRALRGLNENILAKSDLGRGKQIGHSYLLGLEGSYSIVRAWRFSILPLIEEYYFGDFDRLLDEAFGIEDTRERAAFGLFDYTQQQIGDFDSELLHEELGAFIDDHEFQDG